MKGWIHLIKTKMGNQHCANANSLRWLIQECDNLVVSMHAEA